MRTKYLTADERRKSRTLLYQFQAFNGIGFNFMGATPVYLLAIHFGANNYQLGYISSVIFLAGIILVFLPKILAGKNLVRVQAAAWFMRGMVVLLYLLLFELKGSTAIYLILVVYTLFSMSRMIGMAVWNALIKMVADPGGRGRVIAQGNMLNQSGSIISRVVSAVVTSFRQLSGVTGILLLQILGVVFNTAAVLRLRKIPCREQVEYTKGRNIFVILSDALKQKEKRYPLILKWVIISLIVLNGLIIPFLKKEAGFEANYIFLYTLVMTVAAILSALFVKTFADRLGSRPLLLGLSVLLAAGYFLWVILPVSPENPAPMVVYFIIGFGTQFFLLSSNLLISRVVVNSMPEEETFGYNSMVNFVTGVCAAAAGALGGFLINAGGSGTLLKFNSYSYLFVFSFFLSILVMMLSLRMEDKGSLSGKETAAILFSFEGLRAYINIGKMQGAKNPVKKRTVLLSISENESPAVTEELRRILMLPLSASKGEVIKSLFRHPRPALLPELLKEAGDFGSYHQLKAIFALGAYPSRETELLLRKLLDSPDSAVRSNAAKSLGRIGVNDVLSKVTALDKEAETAWDKINYLIALKNMDESGTFLRGIFRLTQDGFWVGFRQTYYSLAADIYSMVPSLSSIFGECNLDREKGLVKFIEETRDQELFFNNHEKLVAWFGEEAWDKILQLCVTALNDEKKSKNCPAHLKRIREGIRELHQGMAEGTDAPTGTILFEDVLAAVYFTYQILS